jgi:uncharacterized membrane protein YvlD (DUF360 family)
MRLLIRIVLKALAFMFLLPLIPGISIHGNFLVAACLAIFFSLMTWLVEIIAMALAAYLTISTLGLALLVLIPMWILGFWLLPAVALKLVGDFMPHYLMVAGWVPAIFGGLVLLVIGMITGSLTDLRKTYVRD